MKPKRLFYCIVFCYTVSCPLLAQKTVAATLSSEICNCLGTTTDTTRAFYNDCFARSFARHHTAIASEYHLNQKSSYEQSRQAGKDMRGKVEALLGRNCKSYIRFKK